MLIRNLFRNTSLRWSTLAVEPQRHVVSWKRLFQSQRCIQYAPVPRGDRDLGALRTVRDMLRYCCSRLASAPELVYGQVTNSTHNRVLSSVVLHLTVLLCLLHRALAMPTRIPSVSYVMSPTSHSLNDPGPSGIKIYAVMMLRQVCFDFATVLTAFTAELTFACRCVNLERQ